MKLFLKFIGKNILTGFAFSVGMLIIILPLFLISEFRNSEEPWDEKYLEIENPKACEIIEHRKVSATQFLTIKGKLRNNSDTLWTTAELKVIVYADTTQIGYFEESIDNIEPKATREFNLVSPFVHAEGLPANITYSVSVKKIRTNRDNLKN